MKLRVYITANWNRWDKRWSYSAWATGTLLEGEFPVTEVEVEFESLDHAEMTRRAVMALRAKQDNIRLAHYEKMQKLDEEIQDLLALPAPGTEG